jgi:hypothetical protein
MSKLFNRGNRSNPLAGKVLVTLTEKAVPDADGTVTLNNVLTDRDVTDPVTIVLPKDKWQNEEGGKYVSTFSKGVQILMSGLNKEGDTWTPNHVQSANVRPAWNTVVKVPAQPYVTTFERDGKSVTRCGLRAFGVDQAVKIEAPETLTDEFLKDMLGKGGALLPQAGLREARVMIRAVVEKTNRDGEVYEAPTLQTLSLWSKGIADEHEGYYDLSDEEKMSVMAGFLREGVTEALEGGAKNVEIWPAADMRMSSEFAKNMGDKFTARTTENGISISGVRGAYAVVSPRFQVDSFTRRDGTSVQGMKDWLIEQGMEEDNIDSMCRTPNGNGYDNLKMVALVAEKGGNPEDFYTGSFVARCYNADGKPAVVPTYVTSAAYDYSEMAAAADAKRGQAAPAAAAAQDADLPVADQAAAAEHAEAVDDPLNDLPAASGDVLADGEGSDLGDLSDDLDLDEEVPF